MSSSPALRRLLGCAALVLSLSAATSFAQTLELLAPVVGRVNGYYTDLTVASGTTSPGTATLTYYFVRGDGSLGVASTSVTVPGRQSVTIPDFIATRLNLWENTLGRIEMSISWNVSASMTLNLYTQFGLQSAGVPTIPMDSGCNMASGSWQDEPGALRDFYSGTKLLLTETTGAWSDVNVQLFDADGYLLGERLYGLGPNETHLIYDIFGEPGMGLPEGDYSNVTIRVAPWGPGRVTATRMWVDHLYGAFDLKVVGYVPPPPTGVIGF